MHPYPAADVYELELYPDLLAQLEDEGEQHLRGVYDVVGVELVGGDHSVEAEAPDPRLLHLRVALEELFARHAVLRLLGLPDDGVAALQGTGVVAAAENSISQIHGSGCGGARTPVRSTRAPVRSSHRLQHALPVRDVVEVDDRAELPRLPELLGGRVVRGEHYRLARVADLLGKHELGQRRAVAPEAELLKKLHEVRIRRRLDREVLAEALVPGKGLLEALRVGAHRLRVVDVERRRPARGRRLYPLLVKGKSSHSLSPVVSFHFQNMKNTAAKMQTAAAA